MRFQARLGQAAVLCSGSEILLAIAGCGDAPSGVEARPALAALAPCTGATTLLAQDAMNCGSCGVRCAASEDCHQGVCIARTGVSPVAAPLSAVAAGTWTERGPWLGGRIDGLAIDSSTSPVTWIAASPGGSVWRRSDTGLTWAEAINYALADFSVVHLEWDVVAPNRLYGATWNSLYASTNRGDNWTALVNSGGTPGALLPSQTAVVDPKPFAQLKFSASQAAVFYARACAGLYYSFGGTSFTQHFPFSGGSGNLDNCIANIAPDPISRRVHFSTLKAVSGESAHVYRSTCAWAWNSPCLSWEPVSSGLPASVQVASLVSTSYSSISNRLSALVGTGADTSTYETTDGASWSLKSTLTNQWNPRPLLYPGSGDELYQGNVKAYYSNNRGLGWSQFSLGYAEHADVRAIFLTPTNVYTATDGAGNTGAFANFTKWTRNSGSPPTNGTAATHNGLKVWQAFYAGIVTPTTPSGARRAFVGSQDNGAVCYENVLTSPWTSLGAPPAGDAVAIQFSPVNPNLGYARDNDGLCFRRCTNCQPGTGAPSCSEVQWLTICPPGGVPLPNYWHRNILVPHPTQLATVWFLGSNAIGYSQNYGSDFIWYQTPAPPTTLYADAVGVLYLGTEGGGVYTSSNNGGFWTPWALNTGSPEVVLAITKGATTVNGETWWVATTSGLYRRIGTGAWEVRTGGNGYVVNDVAVDPNCPTRVYAAFGFVVGRIQHRGGIRVSTDNGTTWSSITAGNAIHNTPVTDVEVDALSPRYLYAASYGRGLWVYDWGTPPTCQ